MPDRPPPPPDDQPEIPPAPAWDDPDPPASAGASTGGRRIAGLPVWAAGTVAGAVVIALVVVLVVALSGGGGDDPDPAAATPPAVTAPDTATGPATTAPPQTDQLDDLPTDDDFAASVARPMDLLGASATTVGSTLAGTSGPGDLARVKRIARRQAVVVSSARRQIDALPTPGRTDHAEALRLLATATGHHRRYLDLLVRAAAGTPSQAHLTALARARAGAARALAAYRRFFALAPSVPDTITSVGLADTAPVRSAIETSIAQQEEARRREAERQRNEGRGDVIPDTAGFQSPTGNLRCDYQGHQLICSSSNDSFGVVLPESGPPVTARGTAAGGATLAYGSVWSRGAFSCQSLTSGLSCENSSGNGFFLSRESYNAW